MDNAHLSGNQDPCDTPALTLEQALELLQSCLSAIEQTEVIPVVEACGRVLRHPVQARYDVPLHTNSAMDGYAIRSADLPAPGWEGRFIVIGTVLAGAPFTGIIDAGQAVRIMTGGVMPEGTDTVLMQEHVRVEGDLIFCEGQHRAGQNVRPAGEDIRTGTIILQPGRLLTPPDIGLIASLGEASVRVTRRLRVAVYSTGDEIQPVGTPLQLGQVYDSNRHSLHAALQRPYVEIVASDLIRDDIGALRATLGAAAGQADLILSSGGVSVGAADHTKDVLAELGRIDFWKIAFRPGRPLAFGHIGNTAFIGLPGNPVSVMATFYTLVQPALEKLAGVTDSPLRPSFLARTSTLIRKKPGRAEYQRGILRQETDGSWSVAPTGAQGSGILSSMSSANAFILLDQQQGDVACGETVRVQPFHGLF